MRQKASMPSGMARVMNGATGSTMAPAASKALAAALMAAWISASSGWPQPGSSHRPSLRPRRSNSSSRQAMPGCHGRLVVSRASGRVSMVIASAASATVRVSGPATRPA